MISYSQLSLKASVISGAVLGLICGASWGSMYGMARNQYVSMMGQLFSFDGIWAIPAGIIVGAVLGAIAAIIYNWALKIK